MPGALSMHLYNTAQNSSDDDLPSYIAAAESLLLPSSWDSKRTKARLTGAFTHAVYLHHRNVQTVEKLERIFHHRRCGRQKVQAAIEAEGMTNWTEHKPVCQCPAIRQGASEHKQNASDYRITVSTMLAGHQVPVEHMDRNNLCSANLHGLSLYIARGNQQSDRFWQWTSIVTPRPQKMHVVSLWYWSPTSDISLSCCQLYRS